MSSNPPLVYFPTWRAAAPFIGVYALGVDVVVVPSNSVTNVVPFCRYTTRLVDPAAAGAFDVECWRVTADKKVKC